MAPPSAQTATRPLVTGTTAPARPHSKETPVPVPKLGSMPSLPTPAAQKIPDARPLPAHVPISTPPPAPAFSVLAPADANLQDVTNGPHRDGRIRNPVPSKLKGKTDGSKGNFSVMHMDVGIKGEATERDAQAKRTSESTALAAQRAFENGYVSLRRSRFVHVPDETPAVPPLPPPVPKPYVPPPAPAPPTTVSTRQTTLNAAETKSEQARLLTLLRSLHPVLVVDQMCKALAFFGGIPGAPPPSDGCFPQSAEANGPGSLFVGWVAEIFPKLGGNATQRDPSPVRPLDGVEKVKRGRGRPKGSKATKARKDKGIKKGPVKRPPAVSEPPPQMQADESWVDVEETVVGEPGEVDANAIPLARATNSTPPQPHSQEGSSQQTVTQELLNQAMNAVNRAALPGSDAVSASPASAKKRGRPKGSKNRPKLPGDSSGENLNSLPTSHVSQSNQATQPVSSASQVPQAAGTRQDIDGLPAFTPVNSTVPTPVKKPNQGKGASNRQAPGGVIEPPRGQETPVPVPVPAAVSNPHPGYTQPAALQQPTHELSQAPSAMPVQPPPVPHGASTGQGNSSLAAQKRKRKGGKEAETLPSSAPAQAHGLNLTTQANTRQAVSTGDISASQATASAAAPRPPPAKRQKKAQDTKPPPERSNTHFTTVPVGTSAPAPEIAAPSTTPSSRQSPIQNLGTTRVLESNQRQPSLSPDSAMASPHSPHHGHFEVQSPTMENYEAQLQAQLEEQSEPDPHPVSTQNTVSSGQLAAARIQQQQQSHFSQRQQPQQQQKQPQMLAQSRSPNTQLPQSTNPQSASPMTAQQQPRTLQTPYSQYRAGNNQYGQQQQQQQQSYATTQSQPTQSQSHFAGSQQASQASTQPTQKQQYAPKPQPPQQLQQPQQQYTSSQQSYSTSQQYSSNQQQLASQQRYQQQLGGSSSTGTVSYTAHHSPQFNPSTSNAFSTADSGYRTSAQSRNVASYPSQRSQSSTPTAASAYRTTNGSNSGQQGLSHHAASFTPNASTAQQQRSAATPNQGMQGIANSFAGGNAPDWAMFDTGSLDAGHNQAGLGMNNANYNMASTGVRASSNAGTRFSSNAMGGYEASGLPYGQ